MAKIRKIYDQTIKPDGSKTTIYPITSTRAVYTPEGETLDSYIKDGYFHGADLAGYKVVYELSELPLEETPFGYLMDSNLYVWVGTNGDTLDGKYQNCGPFKGPRGYDGHDGRDGRDGEPGIQGIQGPQGPVGLTGPRGAKGDKGDTGVTLGQVALTTDLDETETGKALDASAMQTIPSMVDAEEEIESVSSNYYTRPQVDALIDAQRTARQLKENAQDAEISNFVNTVTDIVNNYKPVEIYGKTVNAPDEEDLTSKGGLLKLKDRNNLNGLGYCILRRDKTFGEQVTKDHTIYEIRYDFDLEESEVIIPEGCVLKFNGGSITNGTIRLNGAAVEGEKWCDCTLLGASKSKVKTSWCKTADSEHIQKLLNLVPAEILFDGAEDYKISVEIKGDIVVDGGNNVFIPLHKPTPYEYNFAYHTFYANGNYNITVKNCKFIDTTHPGTTSGFDAEDSDPLIHVKNAKQVIVDNCLFMNIEGGYSGRIVGNYGDGVGLLVSTVDTYQTIVRNCEITGCSGQEMLKVLVSNSGERSDVNVDLVNNYIHDLTPMAGRNGSVTDFVANHINCINNRVRNFNFQGSLFNFFGTNVFIADNRVEDSRCSTVFDTAEYVYFDSDNVTVLNNYVSAKNSMMLETVTENLIMKDNIFNGFCFFGAYNDASLSSQYDPSSPTSYRWFYRQSDIVKKNKSIVIYSNIIDCTNYGADNVVRDIAVGNSAINCMIVSSHEYPGESISIRDNKIKFDSVLKENINSTVKTTTYRPVLYLWNIRSVDVSHNDIEGFNNSGYYKYPISVGCINSVLGTEKIYSIEQISVCKNIFSGYTGLGYDQCLPVTAWLSGTTDSPIEVSSVYITQNICKEAGISFRDTFTNMFIDSIETDISTISEVPIFMCSNNPKLSKFYGATAGNLITRNGSIGILVDSGPVDTPSPFSEGTTFTKGSTINIAGNYYLVGRTFSAPATISLAEVSGNPNLFTANIAGVTVAFKKLFGAKQCNYLEQGAGSSRPTTLTANDAGYQFFDTLLGKPIWWNGSTWKYADGTSVS